MEKFKIAFSNLLKKDKEYFFFIVSQFSIGLLFLISILLPYIVSSSLINGSLPASALPGGTIYTILFLGLVVLFAYFILLENEKQANKIFLVQAIVGTLIFIYALLFHKVGLPDARNGIGKIIEFFMIIMYWVFIFGKKHVKQVISKIVYSSVSSSKIKEE